MLPEVSLVSDIRGTSVWAAVQPVGLRGLFPALQEDHPLYEHTSPSSLFHGETHPYIILPILLFSALSLAQLRPGCFGGEPGLQTPVLLRVCNPTSSNHEAMWQ